MALWTLKRPGSVGGSIPWVEKLAEQLGVTKLSKSQVSVMARELDELVTDFRIRPDYRAMITW